MIELKHVQMSYHGTKIIDDLSFTFPEKGVISLIGPNGAGKSTLLSGIGRVKDLEQGEILINGVNVQDWQQDNLAKELAFLKQEQHIHSRLKVFELVSLGRYPYSKGRYTKEDDQIVADVLDQLELTALSERYLDELSGGQRQRAYIAMVLAQQTPHLLLDEPVASLDMRYSRDMMRLLKKMADEENKCIIIVIHDLNLALGYSDYIIGMETGQIIFNGETAASATMENFSALYHCDVRVSDIDGRKIVFPSL